MDAKDLYHVIFVGNEPYKNRGRRLNNLKRQWYDQFGVELQEDDGWNMLMVEDLYESTFDYVRKSISRVFQI